MTNERLFDNMISITSTTRSACSSNRLLLLLLLLCFVTTRCIGYDTSNTKDEPLLSMTAPNNDDEVEEELIPYEDGIHHRDLATGDSAFEPAYIIMCVKITKVRYITLKVRQENVTSQLQRGSKIGRCSSWCNRLCNHQPCYNDTLIVNQTCRCFPTGPYLCTGVNTRCALNDDSCQCQAGFAGNASTAVGCPDIGFSLPDLPYKTNALEPNIDNRTMYLHHSKHHQTYITNLNKAVNGTAAAAKPIVELQAYALANGTVIRNNAGGHYNHAFFWRILAPTKNATSTKRSVQLDTLINATFGNVSAMITQFNAAGTPSALFGSGWVWLCVNSTTYDKLLITTTPNQDNPLMLGVKNETSFPILGLDVWEHAYYLKYQNLRNDYVVNFWNVVNWDVVSANLKYVSDNKQGVSV